MPTTDSKFFTNEPERTLYDSKVRRKTKTLNSYALGRRNPKRILLRTQKGN